MEREQPHGGVDRLVEDLELIGDESAAPGARALAERITALDLDALFADGRLPLTRTLTGLGADLRQIDRQIDELYFQRKATGRQVQWVQWNGGESW